MSTSGSGLRSTIPPTYQTELAIAQANPISGTLYEVLPVTQNVRLIDILIWVTWTVQPTPLEVHVTIDGITKTFAIANPISLTIYQPDIIGYDGAGILGVDYGLRNRSFLLEGKSIRVQVEITGGTVQELAARVIYAKW